VLAARGRSEDRAGWTPHALKKLTPKHRDVLIAIHFEGRSVSETARQLGVPPGTVKSRAHHASRALRRVLKEVEAA
jgi:RNA polymerase sigma-70 factor (ECF subfamily)